MTRKNCVKTKLSYCLVPWLISSLLCLAPAILDPAPLASAANASAATYDCVLFNTPLFVLASSFFSFYLPLVIMAVLYARVFVKISQQSRRFRRSTARKPNPPPKSDTAK